MLPPKAHLTSHSWISGARWVITPLWFESLSSSVYFCHLFKIFHFCQVHTISVLYCAHLCMKCSLGISNFLEEISSLWHSIVFVYFLALITEEVFPISPCYSLELCTQMGISNPNPFLLCLLLLFFSQLFYSCLQTAILLFCISFSWEWSCFLSPVNLHP